MGAGGGTFTAHNKILPGAYINFVSKPRAMSNLGSRGTVAGLINLSWGKQGEVVTVNVEDFMANSLNVFGYNFTDKEMLYIRELFLGARTLKYYRPPGGAKATTTIGNLKAEALYGGTRGNDIRLIIENDIDDEEYFYVTTLIGKEHTPVDTQRVKDIEELVPNNFVVFMGKGVASDTAGTRLTGGTDAKATGDDYSTFLSLIEKETFTTLFYAGSDMSTKLLFTAYTKRLRNQEGYKITTVLHNYPKADFEGVISVKNEVEGDIKEALVYFTAGLNAGAEVNRSLTNSRYTGELEIYTKYSNRELEHAVINGEFTYYGDNDDIRILMDINTFTSFTTDKNKDFRNNQVIRVLDEIGNSTARIFNHNYLGIVQNTDIGRTILKVEIIKHNEMLQSIQAITNFSAEDVVVEQGTDKDEVIVNAYIEPVSAMSKLYMSVSVE